MLSASDKLLCIKCMIMAGQMEPERLRKTDESGWQIIDVYLDGTVSELALRRSEYSALIKREGFQALLAKLDERIETLSSEPPEEAS